MKKYAKIRTALVSAVLASSAAGTAYADTASGGCAETSQARYQAVVAAVDGKGDAAALLGCGDDQGPDIDAYVCPWFVALQGSYYVGTPFGNVVLVYIAPDGDVDVAGSPFWNCPPY